MQFFEKISTCELDSMEITKKGVFYDIKNTLELVIDLLSVNCLIFNTYKLLVLFVGKTVLVFSSLNWDASAPF